jgi:hypothetical protein
MRLQLAALLLLTVFAIGCDDDSCLSGDRTRCDGNVIQQCDGYSWSDVEDCEESEFGPLCRQLDGGDAYCTDGSY